MTDNLPATTAAGDLASQMEFSKLVSTGSLLPEAYRGQPANVLLAVGLGASMGLSPAESLYRIAVIKGKPTAGAELIAANVRKAGHKLRVTGDETTATAQIIRADDPDYTFEVTRDLAWAKGMGLDRNDNYKKQPGTMLQWRAITAVARLACPEALYGVTYTADEMFDMQGGQPAPAQRPSRPSARDTLAAAVAPDEPEPADASDAEVVEEGPEPLTDKTRGRLFALFNEQGIEDDAQLPGINHILGTAYESRSQLTEADARTVIKKLESRQTA